MIARIIPIESSFDTFGLSYYIPDNIHPAIGELLEIPLRDEISYGIFAGESSEYQEQTEIKSIIGTTTYCPLSADMVETIIALAKRHVIHIHKVLAVFFPKWLLSRICKYGLDMPKEQLKHWSPSKIELHFLSKWEGMIPYLQELGKEGRTVYIFPTDGYMERFISEFQTDSSMGILASGSTDTKRSKMAISAILGEYSIMIWTRRLCTYNLAAFDRVIYIEDAIVKQALHSFHEYSYTEILFERAKKLPSQCIFVSATPSIESMSRALAGEYLLKNV